MNNHTRAGEIITSLTNPRIKEVVKLRSRHHRTRLQKTVIEGYRETTRAFHHGNVGFIDFFFCPALFLGENESDLIESIADSGANVIEVTKDVFKKISYRDRPDGLLGTAPLLQPGLQDIRLNPDPLVVIAERIEKPGNLGTILRTSDATGVAAVVCCDGITDINNPNVVRASTGTLFSVPIAQASLEETISWVRGNGLQLIAATPHSDTIYTSIDYTKPTAIAIGAEQYGLTDAFLKSCDSNVRIPMLGFADSLNVAQAATVMLYEAIRQRTS